MNKKVGISLQDLAVEDILEEKIEANISNQLPMRKWLYAWILDPHIYGNYQKGIDKWIAILIVVNLFALVFESVPVVYEANKDWFYYFDVFSVVVFTIEYLLRFYLAPEDTEFQKRKNPRLGYVTSPFAIVDFLAIAPFYLQAFIPVDLRVLRFLRLLRILKLFRVLVPAYKEFEGLNRSRTFRQKIHAMVFASPYGGKMHDYFQTFIGLWVLISVLAVVLETVQSVNYILHVEFVILDAIAVGIFTIEYCLRIYCCVEEPGFKGAVGGRFKQAKSPSSLIDFFAILPFFLEILLQNLIDLRFLRIFRLVRLLKLTRGNQATLTLGRVVAREWPVIAAAGFIMLLLVVLTASLGYLFEHDAQPDKFENIPTSIYWAVITLASVGYGDISPVTGPGRLMTIVLALIGIGIFAIPAALLSSAFSDELIKERNALKARMHDILADGYIDADELGFIRTEAKRLHLTTAEINQLLKQVQAEVNAKTDLSAMPIHIIAAKSDLAVEHYKALLGQIRQLTLLTDPVEFDEVAKAKDSLTNTEAALWSQIRGQN